MAIRQSDWLAPREQILCESRTLRLLDHGVVTQRSKLSVNPVEYHAYGWASARRRSLLDGGPDSPLRWHNKSKESTYEYLPPGE